MAFLNWVRRRDDQEGTCPFCCPITRLRRQSSNILKCPSCDTQFDHSTMDPILPPQSSEPTPLARRTCIPLPQDKLSSPNPLLCTNCAHHQSILVQLLSAFEGPDDSDGGGWEREYGRFREDLERRYPLCAACSSRVQERLKVVDYKVRSRRLGGGRGREAQRDCVWSEQQQKLDSYRRRVFLNFVKSAEYLLQVCFLILHSPLKTSTLAYLTDYTGVNLNDYSEFGGWEGLIIASAILSFILVPKSLVKLGWIGVLFLVRYCLLTLVSEATQLQPDSFFILASLSFACLVLIYQIYAEWPHFSKSAPNTPRVSTRLSSMDDVPIRPIDSPNLEDKLWDTSIVEKLDRRTPLSVRFADLSDSSSSKKNAPSTPNSPFSLPNVVINPSSLHRSSPHTRHNPTPPSLRPSLFDSVRSNGLEKDFAGFSLSDHQPSSASRTKSTSIPLKYSSPLQQTLPSPHNNDLDENKFVRRQSNILSTFSVDHLLGTLFFVILRIWAAEEATFIAVILGASWLFSGAFRKSLPSPLQYSLNILLILRVSLLLLSIYQIQIPITATFPHLSIINRSIDAILLLTR